MFILFDFMDLLYYFEKVLRFPMDGQSIAIKTELLDMAPQEQHCFLSPSSNIYMV